jgi:hypothetical protein
VKSHPTFRPSVRRSRSTSRTLRARHLAPETVRKRRELLEGKLLPFCEASGYDVLKHLDVDVLRKFRASWPYAPLSARKCSSISVASFDSVRTAGGSIAIRPWR